MSVVRKEAKGEAVLELRSVRMEEGRGPALDLALFPGEAAALVRCGRRLRGALVDGITGLVPPAEGTVRFRGQALFDLPERTRLSLRGRMGVVTDPPVFLNNVRLTENLRLPLRYHTGLDRRGMDRRLQALLQALDMQGFEDAIPTRFEHAFRYRAAVVRALAPAPDLLVVERPEEGLEAEDLGRLPELWKEGVTGRGGAVLLLTESPAVGRDLAERVLVIGKEGILDQA